jgi:hypothetical protein
MRLVQLLLAHKANSALYRTEEREEKVPACPKSCCGRSIQTFEPSLVTKLRRDAAGAALVAACIVVPKLPLADDLHVL